MTVGIKYPNLKHFLIVGGMMLGYLITLGCILIAFILKIT